MPSPFRYHCARAPPRKITPAHAAPHSIHVQALNDRIILLKEQPLQQLGLSFATDIDAPRLGTTSAGAVIAPLDVSRWESMSVDVSRPRRHPSLVFLPYSPLPGAFRKSGNPATPNHPDARAKKKPPRYFYRGGGLKKNPGNELLSHNFRRSTIAAEDLHCRVREGNGCYLLAMVTGKNP